MLLLFVTQNGTKIIGILHMLYFLLVIAFPFLYAPSGVAFHLLRAMIYESIFLDVAIFNLIMLFGVFKCDHQLIFPWVVLQFMMTLFLLFTVTGNLVYLGLMDYRNENMELEFLVAMYLFYTVLVVYNFYRELKEERQSEQC